MRPEVTKERLFEFMTHLGRQLNSEGRIYLTGEASALLHDWRTTTIDIDLSAEPEPARFFPAIAEIKNSLQINIELVSPADFVPSLPGWIGRSKFIDRYSKTDFFHYDFFSQAFSKLARSHDRDLSDVEKMHQSGFIDPGRLKSLVEEAREQIIRYPSLSESHLIKAINDWCEVHI